MTTNIREQIREGQVVSLGYQGEEYYRAVFVGKNFFLYKFVKKGRGYRGVDYPEDGYTLAWSDNFEYGIIPPSFVPLRG